MITKKKQKKKEQKKQKKKQAFNSRKKIDKCSKQTKEVCG
jgi:hypothetical protein